MKELSVVIPIHNEEAFILETLDDLQRALEKWSGNQEIILVLNGSTDGTNKLLEKFRDDPKIVVKESPEANRLKARILGLRTAQYERILLLDSRIRIDENSILNMDQFLKDSSKYLNGHVRMAENSNPYEVFWEILTRIGWSRYFSEGDVIEYGPIDFDKYPKGTGFFCAPRRDLLLVMESVLSESSNNTTAVSDDTRVLRKLIENGNFWISKNVSAVHVGRQDLISFLKNAKYRGQTFVDSYWNTNSYLKFLTRLSLPSFSIFLIIVPVLPKWLPEISFFILVSLVLGYFIFLLNKMKIELLLILKILLLVPPFFAVFGTGFFSGYFAKLKLRMKRTLKSAS